MEVTIGVRNVAREISIESDDTPEQIRLAVEDALSQSGGVLRLRDAKGRQVLVPGSALGYVQLGESEKSRVGFGLT